MTLIFDSSLKEEAEAQIVSISLKVENCPPFLEELRKSVEESIEQYPDDVGNDIICIGGEGKEKFIDELRNVGILFQLVFDNGTTCRIAVC